MTSHRKWKRAVALGILLTVGCAHEPYYATAPPREGKIRLIVRIDDVGILQATNQSARNLLHRSIATDYSLVVNTPWFPDAAKTLREVPEHSVGVQLTLASPWQNFRWGPVLERSQVPLLVYQDGNFYPDLRNVQRQGVDSLSVIREFRAQIHKAFQAGLEVAYIHWPLQAEDPRWMRDILETLAWEFQIGITDYFDERKTPALDGRTEKEIMESLKQMLNGLVPGLWVLALPAGERTPEMLAAGLPDTAAVTQRANTMKALQSNTVAALCAERGIQLISYRQLLEHAGLWRQISTTEKRPSH